jgi:hypothetical protein
VSDHLARVLRSPAKQRLEDEIPPDTLREIVESRILSLITPPGRDCAPAAKTAGRLASKVVDALRGGEVLERAGGHRDAHPSSQPRKITVASRQIKASS